MLQLTRTRRNHTIPPVVFEGPTLAALAVGVSLAAIVGVFARAIGYDRDRAFYPTVLTVVGSLYVLFAVIAGGGPALFPEIVAFAAFAGLAAIGFRTTLWLVAAGLTLHGVFDFVRHDLLPAPGAPTWWPAFCGAYDIVAASGLTLMLLDERRRRGKRPIYEVVTVRPAAD